MPPSRPDEPVPGLQGLTVDFAWVVKILLLILVIVVVLWLIVRFVGAI